MVPMVNLKRILKEELKLDEQTLAGRRAVVSGSAMGIGKQVALALAHLGARVALVDREVDQATEVADEIRALGGEALVVAADIGRDGEYLAALAQVEEAWQGIDILVNNAAKAFIGSHGEETQSVWDEVFETNLRQPAAAIKRVLPAMLAARLGVIVNVISLEGLAFSSAYSATKVGMRSLTASLAAEIGPEAGVHVLAFAPGIVDTPLVRNYFYSELASRFGMTMDDIIQSIGGNPGYPGLMPAEHCAAGLVSYLVNARHYHGHVVNPFLPLSRAGIIQLEEELPASPSEATDPGEDAEDSYTTAVRSMQGYLKSVTRINQELEERVEARTEELTRVNRELTKALEEVKTLSGLLPICSFCKKIRDDQGYWKQLETYLHDHSEATFSHGICESCLETHYPDLDPLES